jgi:hypothetical protein
MPTYFWQSATFIAHFSSKGSPMKVSPISLTVVLALVGVSGSAFAESSSRYSGGGNVYEFKAKFDQNRPFWRARQNRWALPVGLHHVARQP